MNAHDHDQMRQELLELHFDCHPDPEPLRRRLAADAELRELYDDVRGTAELLREAAHDTTPAVEVPARRRRGWLRRGLVAAGLLWALVVLVPLSVWGYESYHYRQARSESLRVVLSGPAAVPPGTPLHVRAECWNADGEARPAQLEWRLLADDGASVASGRAKTDGSRDLELPPFDLVAGRPGTSTPESSRRRLEVTARAGGEVRTAVLALRATREAPLAHLTTDKSAYRPGETVRMRAVLLDRLRLEPREGTLRFRITDPRGGTVVEQRATAQQGVVAMEWKVPDGARGGHFGFELRDGSDAFTYQRQEFLVRHYQPPQLDTRIDLDRETYAPGERGSAEIRVARLDGTAAKGARVETTLVLDGDKVSTQAAELDERGHTTVDFAVPEHVERGAARLVARITDGSLVETRVEPFVVPTGQLDVTLFPEGGELVAGVPNRVYAEVLDPLGRPASARGVVIDDGGRPVARFETANQGRGRFELTPRPGTTYRLRLDGHEDEPVALPAATPSGVTLRGLADVTPAGAPLRMAVHTPGEGPWMIGAFLRGVLVGQDAFRGAGRHDVALDLPAQAAGVLRVTVFDARMTPIAERLVQRASGRRITVAIEPEHAALTPGDSQAVELVARDESGAPVRALLGVAVTDDAVRAMTGTTRIGLADRTWLAGDVENLEDIEDFTGTEPDTARNVDLLLGTRGWRRFLWTRASDRGALVAELGEKAQRVILGEGFGHAPVVADSMPSLARLAEGVVQARSVARVSLGASVALLAVIALALGLARLPGVRLRLLAAGGLIGGLLLGLSLVVNRQMERAVPQFEAVAAVPAAEPADAAQLDAPAPDALDEGEFALGARRVFFERWMMVDRRAPAKGLPVDDPVDLPADLEEQADDDGVAEIAENQRIANGKLNKAIGPDAFRPRQWDGLRLVRVGYQHRHVDTGSRGDFAETLYWNGLLQTGDDGRARLTFDTSDRVTTWRVDVDAQGAGRVGQATATFVSRLPFSLHATLPDEVSQGDRLQLPVALVQHGDGSGSAQLRLSATGALKPIGSTEQTVALTGGRGRATFALEVGAAAKSTLRIEGRAGRFADTVEHTIRVVPRGYPHHVSRGGLLRDSVELEIAMPDTWVEGSKSSVLRLYPSPLATLSQGMEAMLREPCGCFEQASSSNYPNVMLLGFLDATGSDAPALAGRARRVLDKGYRLLTGYECNERGFEWFGEDPGHEALSAYGLLEFTDMQRVFDVDGDLIGRTRRWLLARRDGKGGFLRNQRALDSFGRAPQPVTDAYVTYALAATGTPESDIRHQLDRQQERAATTDDSYELAVAACALAEGGRQEAAALARQRLAQLQAADGSVPGATTSITGSGGNDLLVETTSFAVLAWLADDELRPQVEKATQFLLEQRSGRGSFGATQATIMALKALTEYARRNHHPAHAGRLEVWINGKLLTRRGFPADQREPIVLRDLHELLLPGPNRMRLTLTGDNEFPWSFDVDYCSEQPADDAAGKVDIRTELGRDRMREGDTVPLHIAVHNRTAEKLPMTMAVVGLPAGLHCPTAVLDDLRKAGVVDLWEITGRELVFYWRGMAPEQTREVTVDLVARVPGVTRGPASRAYLYYTPAARRWAPPLTLRIE